MRRHHLCAGPLQPQCLPSLLGRAQVQHHQQPNLRCLPWPGGPRPTSAKQSGRVSGGAQPPPDSEGCPQVYRLPYYEACVQDTCACDTGGDCECLCDAVAAYAKACMDKGVCVDWRSPDFCRESCSGPPASAGLWLSCPAVALLQDGQRAVPREALQRDPEPGGTLIPEGP